MIKIKNKLLDFKDFIDYIKNYKKNIKKLDNVNRDIGNLKYDIKRLQEALALDDEQINNYLKRINEKNRQIRKLRKQNNFLIERDNKLQQIEMVYKKSGALKKIKEIMKGD